MNPFESGERKAIPAVLVYLKRGSQVLMMHRSTRGSADYHSGKWNGIGGKSELDESPCDTARRETQEEASVHLPLERFRALGMLTFPNFKAHKSEDWIVTVFVAHLSEEEILSIPARTEEGELHWVERDRLPELSLWAGDQHFIPYVVAEKPFIGTIWYQGEIVHRVWMQGL